MDENTVRLLIRKLLQNGRLPHVSASNVSGSPATGEICAACGTAISEKQLVMQATVANGKGANPIEFHVFCFELWNDERRKLLEQMA
jgi:hypothetical protein